MQYSLHLRLVQEHVKTKCYENPAADYCLTKLFNRSNTLRFGWQLCIGQKQPMPIRAVKWEAVDTRKDVFSWRWPEKAAEFELLVKPNTTLLFRSKLLFMQICKLWGGLNKCLGFYPSSAMKNCSGVGCVWIAHLAELAIQHAVLLHIHIRELKYSNDYFGVCLPCV